MIKKREPVDHAMIYVGVTSVEEYAKKVNKNGGKILVQKIEVKEWNISFIMKIQKNRFVLWEGM
jgi:predicted enzyme related to lactoylglutathione lyase